MKLKNIVIATILPLLVLSGCGEVSSVKKIKLSHGLDPTHPVHKAMIYMGKVLKERSEGKMELEIYPSGQLGSEQQSVELLQIGSLAITKVSVGTLEAFSKNYQVLALPYIFRSKEHSFNVLDGEIGDRLLESTTKYNIKGLCFYDAGARSFYTGKGPINKPEDLNGLKVRVMNSPTAVNTIKALGGSPTPISWGELFTSLQSGVVDVAENNPASLYTSHHYEACKYYSIDEHSRLPDVLIMSTVVWNSLNEQEQKWLTEAANESVKEQRKLWDLFEIESMSELKKAGVEISYPDKSLFREKVKPFIDSYKDKPELYKLLQDIRAVE